MYLIKLIELYHQKNLKKLPKKIKIGSDTYVYSKDIEDYRSTRTKHGFFSNNQFFENELYKEVEILKDEIPKINYFTSRKKILQTINKLINEVDKLKEKGE